MDERKKHGWPFWLGVGVIAVVAVFALPFLIMIPFLLYDLVYRFLFRPR